MTEITHSQKNYLQKISSLPTGLPKPLKLQRHQQPQTTTSTPTGRKMTSFSSQSHFFSTQKQKPHLPSALSTHTIQQVDHSFNSISSRIQNDEQKQNLMKKQSIYLYIRKYLNAEDGNITKMKFKSRYSMYRPEPGTERKDFLQTSKGYLPRVNVSVDKSMTERRSRNGAGLDITTVKGNKKSKILPSDDRNLQTSGQSNISSRRRVNQMLKRDKQLNNLHRNGHDGHSHSSSQQTKHKSKISKSKSKSKGKQKKVNSIISEQLETLEQGIQVNMEEEAVQRERQERERQQRIEKEKVQRQALEKQRMSKLKQQITSQIMQKIAQKQQQTHQAEQQSQSLKHLSLTEQLSMLQNRQNQFNLFIQKVQEQHSFKNLAQLKQIIDNSLPLESKKQLVDKEVSCRLVDVQEMTAKEKERLEREIQMQRLRDELDRVRERQTQLENERDGQARRAVGQEGVEKELKQRLESLKKELEEQVKGKMSLMVQKQVLQKKQIQNEQRQKQLEQNLYKQQNKYQYQSLNSALDLIKKLSNKAQIIQSSISQNQSHQQKISSTNQSIVQIKQNQQLSQIESVKMQLKCQQTVIKQKIRLINNHLKQEHQRYIKLLQARKQQSQERKESLQLSHLSLRQKVADMQMLKEELKQLKDQLQIIVLKHKQAQVKYQQQIQQFNKAKSAKPEKKKPQLRQKKYNQQSVNSQVIKNNQSLLKLANECSWGLFPIQQTKEQQTVTFALQLKQNHQQKHIPKQQLFTKDQPLERKHKNNFKQSIQGKTVEQRQDQLLKMKQDVKKTKDNGFSMGYYEQGMPVNNMGLDNNAGEVQVASNYAGDVQITSDDAGEVQIINRKNRYHQKHINSQSQSYQQHQQHPYDQPYYQQQLDIDKNLNTPTIPDQTNDYDQFDHQQSVHDNQNSNSQLELHYFDNNHPMSETSHIYGDNQSDSQFQCYQDI